MNGIDPRLGKPITRQMARQNGIPVDSIWPLGGQQQNDRHNDHAYHQNQPIISPLVLSLDSNPFRLGTHRNPLSDMDMSTQLNRMEADAQRQYEQLGNQQQQPQNGGEHEQREEELLDYDEHEEREEQHIRFGEDGRTNAGNVGGNVPVNIGPPQNHSTPQNHRRQPRMAKGTIIPPEGQIEFEIPLTGQAPQIAHTQQFFYHPQPVSAAGNFGYWQGFVLQPQTTPRQDQPPARGGNQPMRAQPQIMPQSQPRANLVDRHPIGQQGNVGLAFANQQHGSPRVHFTDQTPRIQRQMPLGPPPGFQQQPIPSVQSSEQLLMLNSFQCLSHTLVLDRLPELKGNEGADKLKSFFKKFDNATQTWSDKERIGALESKVYGRAERALNAALNTQPYVYSSIRRHMIQQLEDTDAREMEAFDTLMRGVIRKPGENVDDLGERVSGLVRRAYPGLSINLADEYSIKHLIRSLGDPDLAMNLELSRRPAMSLDEFVSMAARAEATRRTFRQQNLQNTGMNRKPDVQQQQTNFQFQPKGQGNGQTTACYNCGKSGHFSRDCFQPRREAGGSNQSYSQANVGQQNAGNWVATGANSSRVANRNFGNFQQQPAVQKPAVPPRNFIKQNLLTIEEENRPVIGGIHASEIADYFKNVEAKSEGLGIESIGKLVSSQVEILGVLAKGVIDCGAQLSLLSASFLYNLIEKTGIDCSARDFEFAKGFEIFDVNGKSVNCCGSIKLPIMRKGESTHIRFNITCAPFGFELLFGTNALDALGFRLFDERDGRMIRFESSEPNSISAARVIFSTTIPPQTMELVEVKLEKMKGEIAVIDGDGLGDCRIEPALITVGERAMISVMNVSVLPMSLVAGDVIGSAEVVKNFAEADDCLSSPLIAEMTVSAYDEGGGKAAEVKEQWEKIMGNLTGEEANVFGNLVDEYGEIFALSDEELRQTDLVSHKIELTDENPVRMKMRPVPYAFREKVAAMIQDYLARGVVRPSSSPFASPIVLVPKKDGSLRFCVDYRTLNAKTVKDAFPLPNIDNTLLMLGNKKVFSTLDFLSGYWQIRMEKESIPKTAFLTEFGLHEFVVMPFGLSNAVATFQRFMSALFEGMLFDFVFVYIDDILIASESLEQHVIHLRKVFERIRGASLRLKIQKCKIAADEIPFLGHVLTRNGIKMDSNKVQPVLDLPLPRNIKELQSFLGFAAYYRKFIYAFGEIAAPLYRLLRGENQFLIGEKEEEAIRSLKEKIVKDVVLYFPNFEAAIHDPKRGFILMTDASKIGISAVLCQPDEEFRVRPIYFASRQCNKHEARYCPTELEALAVRFGAKKFAQFISMIPTRVLTDHKALVYMFRSKAETGNYRVDRWIMELNARFVLKVEFCPGKCNHVADILSRSRALIPAAVDEEGAALDDGQATAEASRICQLQIAEEGTLEDEMGKWEYCPTELEDEMRMEWVEQTKESEYKEMYAFLQSRVLPVEMQKRQKILDQCPQFSVIEGLLYLGVPKSDTLRLFVPQKFRENLIAQRHSGFCAGHQSGTKLFRQLSSKYFWPNLRGDCNNVALNCRICAHARNPRSNQPGLNPIVTHRPLELVCMDILKIGKSNSENKYILVMVDHFSKYVVAEPVPDKSAETVARVFVDRFLLIYGTPEKIHSDRGKEFVNQILEGITKLLGIEKSMTAGYDPNGNGMAERVNQIIINMLKRSTESCWEWDLRLPFCVFVINVTPSESTGLSPFSLMFGKVANMPEDIHWDVNPKYTVDEETYLQAFRENIARLMEEAGENLSKSRERATNWYNSQPKVRQGKFAVGDKVMVIFPGHNRRSTNPKLVWNHFGPYVIIQLEKASASCIPVDKPKHEPIRVPIERLVKIPVGVPDISTLPKGKNPYRNVLCGFLGALAQWEDYEEKWDGKYGNASQLGTIAIFSGWAMSCSGKDHMLCSEMHAADLDPILDKNSELGQMRVGNPLKAVLAIFILRDGVAKTTAAAQQMTKSILEAELHCELSIYSSNRKDFINTGLYPTSDDISKALGIWAQKCQATQHWLRQTGFGPLEMDAPLGVNALAEAEQEGWKKALKDAGWLLELIRDKEVHRKATVVEATRVLIGDSSAKAMLRGMVATEWVGQEGGLNATIRQLSQTALSSKVRVALIIAGRDGLMAGETVAIMGEQIRRLLDLLQQFAHVKIVWVVPQYVHKKKAEHLELVRLLQAMLVGSGVHFACTTADFRSLLEVCRYGPLHNEHMVNADGELTNAGIRAIRAWLYCEVPGIGDDDLNLEKAGRPGPSPASRCLEGRVDVQRRGQHQQQRGNGYRWENRSRSPLRRSPLRNANWRH